MGLVARGSACDDAAMSRTVPIAVIAGLAIAACGRAAPPLRPVSSPTMATTAAPRTPLPLDQDLPRLARRGSELLQELARAFETSGEDCGAAVTRLLALKASHGDVIAANAKVLRDGRGQQLQGALAAYAAASSAAASSIMGSKTMTTCAGDRAFTNAYDELLAAP